MGEETLLQDILRRLDTMAQEPTDFEAGVLETCLRQRTWASAKQRRIVRRMAERYLPDSVALAAELAGQERLFA